jgi:hypothetical protein
MLNFALHRRFMDSRLTLNIDETFLKILESSFEQKEKVNLLLDEGGITRAEGFILSIHKEPSRMSIELDGERTIDLKTIVAVNGIFRPEYGEC